MGGTSRHDWRQKAKELPIKLFHSLSAALLSLLIPLSFLLLSRLSLANNYYLPTLTYPNPSFPFSFFLFSIFCYANRLLLLAIVFCISIATLVHGLTGKMDHTIFRHRLYVPWIFLFVLQASVVLGVKGSIPVTVSQQTFLPTQERTLMLRAMLFLGLYEIMLMWFRVVVKHVVDDTIFGVYKEEGWSERAALALSFSMMWWWKLRSQREGLVVVAEAKAKKEPLAGLEGPDFVNWWLYYLSAGIGLIRVSKGLWYVWTVLPSRLRRDSFSW